MPNKAKRASRGSIKEPMPIPYTATSPFLLDKTISPSSTALAAKNVNRGTKSESSMSIFSRVASIARRVLQTQPDQLRYGDILRDLPFHVNTRTVAFFSTHPSLCERVFAVRHGHCLRLTRGPWAGRLAVVVGVRGGRLWVLKNDGPAIATPLAPQEAERRGWERAESDATLLARLREGLGAARRDAELDYDAEQKEFLQKAPDFYAEVVDDGGEEDFPLDDASGGSPDDASGDAAEENWEEAMGGRRSETPRSHSEESRGVSAKQSTLRKRVTLVPQVVQATGELGWAGEGMIVVNGGGVESFSASLSASILL